MSLLDRFKSLFGREESIDKIREDTDAIFHEDTRSEQRRFQQNYEKTLIDEKIIPDDNRNDLKAISESLQGIDERLLPKNKTDEDYISTINDIDENIYKDLGYPSDSISLTNKQSLENIVKIKIIRYREISRNPEIEEVISDIINEAIITESEDQPVKLQIDIDNTLLHNIDEGTIEKVYNIFDDILDKLEFGLNGHEIFQRWFIDGRLYVWTITNDSGEITGYKILDPLMLSIEETEIYDKKLDTNVKTIQFVYDENQEIPIYAEGINNFFAQSSGSGWAPQLAGKEDAIRIPYEEVIFANAGEYDYLLKVYISPIERSIKTLNQLNNLEDAMVLHQFIRAIKRRVFYINTGNLPRKKAEDYLNLVQQRHKESLGVKYDTETGEVKLDDKIRFLSMFDDYFIRADDKTKIEEIGGSETEWETITDKLVYFRRKLYRNLKVPFSRYSGQEQSEEYKMGAEQLSRQEVKFYKYIQELRRIFTRIFYDLLERDVISSNLLQKYEWELLKNKIKFEWIDDNYFSQLKSFEILDKKLNMIGSIDDFLGKYFTKQYVFKQILGLNDQEIEDLKTEMSKERARGEYEDSIEGGGAGMGAEEDFGGADEFGGVEGGAEEEVPDIEDAEITLDKKRMDKKTFLENKNKIKMIQKYIEEKEKVKTKNNKSKRKNQK